MDQNTIWGGITRFVEALFEGDIQALIATVLASVTATLLIWVMQQFINHHKIVSNLKDDHEKTIDNLTSKHVAEITSCNRERQNLQNRLIKTNDAVEGNGLWLAKPPTPADGYLSKLQNSIPIVTVANLKGGVGKTTATGNLAAFFAFKGKKVLVVDLDFQGSLSSMGVTHNLVPPSGLSAASLLCKGHLPAEQMVALLQPIAQTKNAILLPAYYDLARTENAVMVHWLTNHEKRDARYFIADALLDPLIQDTFDLILFDSPPRLTTSSIQALCSSTHLIIPTILDTLSTQAVIGFIDQIIVNKEIWPKLKVSGVIGSMISKGAGHLSTTNDKPAQSYLTSIELDSLFALKTALQTFQDTGTIPLPAEPIFPIETFIPRKTEIGRAAEDGLAYIEGSQQIREIFERLGQETARRIGLKL